MQKWTADDFHNRHLEHRLNVLPGFRFRRTGCNGPEYSAMKDGAIVTRRVLWELMGVVLNRRKEVLPAAPKVRPVFTPFQKLPTGITVRPFSQTQFDALACSRGIVLVLVAANNCVAHIDEYPEHGVTQPIPECVIDTTIREIAQRVSSYEAWVRLIS